MSEIKLGDKVKDTITGLIGIATARCLYIHGCDHIGIQPPADNEKGKVPSLVWVDSPQVEVIKAKKKKEEVKKIKWGGPGGHPNEKAHPEYDEGVHLK